jgi:hypothetical protein
MGFQLRDKLKNYRATAIAESKIAPTFTTDVAMRLIIPGWAQFYLRRPGRGYVFMIAAGIAFLMAVVFVGTSLGNLALGAMFSMHSASISDAVMAPGSTVRESIGGGLMVYILLGALIYLPSIWLIGRVTVPYRLQENVAPFLADDVLLVRHYPHPKVGDIVVYARPAASINLTPQMGERRYMRTEGLGIDRILAGPGDHLHSVKNQIFVNDQPIAFRPLNSPGGLPPLDVHVPAASYFIWPSALNQWGYTDQFSQISLIAASDVSGVVYFRSSPWARAGFIR